MLNLPGLLPAPLHRVGLRAAHACRKIWWRIATPRLNGCRVLARDGAGRLLLIRHSYGTGAWMPPGGGVDRGEDPVAAGRRELAEEVGLELHDARCVASSEDTLHGAGNAVHIIAGRVTGPARPDGREIIEAGFFAMDALPQPLARELAERLSEWLALADGNEA